WKQEQTSLFDLALWDQTAINIVGTDGEPERYVGARVTSNMFDVLKVRPQLGRGFVAGEDEPGAEPVVILGHNAWQDRFGGSPGVLGRTVKANGTVMTIVGVAPEGFKFPIRAELWIPLEVNPLEHERGEGPRNPAYGRLRDGVDRDQAAAEFAALAGRQEQEYPEANEGYTALVEPWTDFIIDDDISALLLTMLAAVLGVLLISCANVANLLFARAAVREKEVAIRSALGAGRRRIVRQLLTEVAVLSFVGASLGVLIGLAGISWFDRSLAVNPPPFWMSFGMDSTVILFVIGITVLSAVAAGLLPAMRSTGKGMNDNLKEEGRGSSGLRLGRVTSGIVIGEVAVSCALLIAAGLMIGSVVKLRTLDMPFAIDDVFTARINLPDTDYPEAEDRTNFYELLLRDLQEMPGAQAATLSDGLPASGNGLRGFELEGESYPTEADFPRAREGIVTPGYFATFETPILEGRAFEFSDHLDNLGVAIVNSSFVERFFAGREPLGRRMRIRQEGVETDWLRVVGVVPDLKMEGIGNNDADPAGYYVPVAQSGEILGGRVSMALRAGGDPMALTSRVRETVASLDSNLPIYDAISMTQVIRAQTWFYRTFGTLFMAFGFVALFLASVGLYGVMSFSVKQREREMGIRMALGAYNGRLIRLAMRRGLTQLAIGITLGIGLAMALTVPLAPILYGVNARDPVIFAAVVLSLVLTGLLATFIPARRVTRINPAVALTPG
ncbi:MAG: ABC transporter permease, partial [Gemmatimonadota bacterium]